MPQLNTAPRERAQPVNESAATPVDVAILTPEQIVRSFIEPILVGLPIMIPFKGAVSVENAVKIWLWLVRDVDADLSKLASHLLAQKSDMKLLAGFTSRVAAQIAAERDRVSGNFELTKRLAVQLGGEDVLADLECIQKAFKFQPLLAKAVAFGHAVDKVRDENALGLALNSLPVEDPIVTALLMQACVGAVSNPFRLISVVVNLAGENSQAAVAGVGLGAFIEAIVAHAQDQVGYFANKTGLYMDTELARLKLDRFHRLARGLSIITDDDHRSEWAKQIALLIRRMSELVEPFIVKVDVEVRQSLRRPRAGPDRLDDDLLLAALNGVHLLAAAKEAKDSLALNSVIETAWTETGRALEILTTRNLDSFRSAPEDDVAARRLDAGIQMSIIRFNPEYGEILQRAKDGAGYKGNVA